MVVKRLPKTRSGKILRGTMRQIADGETWKMPATIDDPAILEEITGVMSERGMVKDRRWRPELRSRHPRVAIYCRTWLYSHCVLSVAAYALAILLVAIYS